MKTIERILEENNLTVEEIKSFEKIGIVNGCGGKGGFNFTNKIHKFKNYLSDKSKKLLEDIRLLCAIHDIEFHNGKTFNDFIKANYKLANNTMQLLHWTGYIRKIIVWVTIFFGTSVLGWKYFNK